jgi:hypothetical protein
VAAHLDQQRGLVEGQVVSGLGQPLRLFLQALMDPRMASSRRRLAGSAKTSAASLLRSSCPASGPDATITCGQAAAISACAGWPGFTTSRASWSASITGTPRSCTMRPTVDLPDPMPPVSPTSFS